MDIEMLQIYPYRIFKPCSLINLHISELPYGWERKIGDDNQIYFVE